MGDAFTKALQGELEDEEFEKLFEESFAGDPSSRRRFLQHFEGAFVDPNRRDLLNRSLLVSAVAAFEALLARLLTYQIHLFPKLLDPDDKKFSLRELQEFASIDDARAAAVSDRVDSLMRERFEDWQRWFEKRASISLSDLCIDLDVLSELFQRRHIIVHNDGHVSRQYLTRLGLNEPPVGTWLSTPAKYLERALDELNVIGVSLGGSLAAAWFPAERAEAQEAIHMIAYQLLDAERYICTTKLAEVGGQLGDGNTAVDKMILVNGWIAKKRLYGIDSVRGDIEAWDVSALAGQFAVAKAALLDDFTLLFETLLPDAVNRKDLKLDDIQTWPLFKEIRQEERYEQFLAELAGGAE